jgi:hypothetical protein
MTVSCTARYTRSVNKWRDLAERFHSYIRKRGPRECWEWTGPLDTHKRGQLGYTDPLGRRRMANAPRLSYEMHVDKPPRGMEVCHTCDNGACVNPAHLYLGTHQQNMTDRAVRERGGSNRLTAENVREIRARNAAGESQQSLAAAFGVHIVTVSDAIRRATWAHVA